MRVAVLDHGMGNLRSVAKALETAGAEVTIAAERAEIESCDALCVPGQGIFGRAMSELDGRGLSDLLRSWIAQDRPYLGICLGMQLLFESSEERGPVAGLGVLAGTVVGLRASPGVRVPHIGWNSVGDESYYFDHSFAARPQDRSIICGRCHHGTDFAAVIRSGCITAVQFHPEKSGSAGIALLARWVAGGASSS